MKIPTSFQLGGIKWKVETKDVLPNALGLTNSGVAEIWLSKQLPPQVKDQTYCHELVHAILFAMGKPEHDELFVDGFATFLHQYFIQYHK